MGGRDFVLVRRNVLGWSILLNLTAYISYDN